ncbi:MAG: recombination mediator RecR [Porticoccaceae bacterium]|nr:recombination mediator RecR [Porticoccaceae bacterium]MEA3300468.1 recombination mediator RecR [Pseudomonadota bacterium]HLS98430.1 recombination mediator RecR [Porticoccaceae bacterium]
MFGPVIDELIDALRCLPGVGPKSAQRMALHLLERNREGGLRLATAIDSAARQVSRCQRCRNLTENDLCAICANPRRDDKRVCVVETPADLFAIEQSGSYRGLYFVLMGHLSPIDGIGPEAIGVDQLMRRLDSDGVEELILATNLTIEGEATAHYIGERARGAGVSVTRIAHGVPLGGELEYVDGGTLAHAFNSRKQLF